MDKKGNTNGDVTLTFDQVFTLVNRGEGESEDKFFVADVGRYGGISRVFFKEVSGGYQLRSESPSFPLVAPWDIADKNCIWRLERSIWNKHVLNLTLYRCKSSGDKDWLWSGCVFSNRNNACDVVSFIKRRQNDIKKEEEDE